MADLNGLQLVAETVEVDFDNYVPPSEFPPPIPEGVYTFRQGKPKFEAKDGYLVAAFEAHIVEGGEQDGKKVTFDRVGLKPFERQGVKVSMMLDHIKALGVTDRPRTQQDFATIVENSEGKTFKGQVQWEGFCNHKGTPQEGSPDFSVKGERNFPSLNGGASHADETKCPTCGNTVRARARISRRIPAV